MKELKRGAFIALALVVLALGLRFLIPARQNPLGEMARLPENATVDFGEQYRFDWDEVEIIGIPADNPFVSLEEMSQRLEALKEPYLDIIEDTTLLLFYKNAVPVRYDLMKYTVLPLWFSREMPAPHSGGYTRPYLRLRREEARFTVCRFEGDEFTYLVLETGDKGSAL